MAVTVNPAEDLSAGDEPPKAEKERVQDILSDAANRRKYRIWSVLLTVMVVVFLCALLLKIACSITFDIGHFSPWIVGVFATCVVAVTVLTIALLRAAFAPPSVDSDSDISNTDSLPHLSALSELLKTIGGTLESIGKSMGKS